MSLQAFANKAVSDGSDVTFCGRVFHGRKWRPEKLSSMVKT